MTSSILLESLESLLSVKQQRLTITRSPRSREVLKREIQSLRHQISLIHCTRGR